MDLTLIARGMGVSIRYGTPPGGWWGLWAPHHRTIVIRKGLTLKQWRYTLAHEIGHAHHQHYGHHPDQEFEADLYAAHTLIDTRQLRAAMDKHQCHVTVAEHLGVFPRLVRALERAVR